MALPMKQFKGTEKGIRLYLTILLLAQNFIQINKEIYPRKMTKRSLALFQNKYHEFGILYFQGNTNNLIRNSTELLFTDLRLFSNVLRVRKTTHLTF